MATNKLEHKQKLGLPELRGNVCFPQCMQKLGDCICHLCLKVDLDNPPIYLPVRTSIRPKRHGSSHPRHINIKITVIDAVGLSGARPPGRTRNVERNGYVRRSRRRFGQTSLCLRRWHAPLLPVPRQARAQVMPIVFSPTSHSSPVHF